jgi:hypothetical protein
MRPAILVKAVHSVSGYQKKYNVMLYNSYVEVIIRVYQFINRSIDLLNRMTMSHLRRNIKKNKLLRKILFIFSSATFSEPKNRKLADVPGGSAYIVTLSKHSSL